jgi:hypothetical protein
MARVLPKPAMVLPSIVRSYGNGAIPASMLEPSGFGRAMCVSPAARAFRAFKAVEVDPLGIELRDVGGYRDLHGQWRIFGGSQARYEPCSMAHYLLTPSDRRKTFRAENRSRVRALGYVVPDEMYWRKVRLPGGGWPATAAEPGESNHGWACAIDVAEERDGDPEAESLSPRLLEALITRGHAYGLGAEMDVEPWHWRYFAGDQIPVAVLAYETPPVPQRPTVLIGTQSWPAVMAQQILTDKAGGNLEVDGKWGQQSATAWRDAQAWCRWPRVDDDIIGDDWDLLAWIDGGWDRLNSVGVR